MAPEVVVEARELAGKIQKCKEGGQAQTEEAQHRNAVYTLGTRLEQVARNSLLDKDSLRLSLVYNNYNASSVKCSCYAGIEHCSNRAFPEARRWSKRLNTQSQS